MEVSAVERPVSAVASALCWSYTEAERQHLFRVTRLFVTCYYVYVSYYGLFVLDLEWTTDHPFFDGHGDRWWWKCISIWNMILQILYFVHCTVTIDFVDSVPGKTWLKPRLEQNKKIRDYVFISILFPLTIGVCVMFWVIFVISKPLLLPVDVNTLVPEWFNHAVHTNPIVFTLFDMVTTKKSLPDMTKSTVGLFAVFGSYVLCLLYHKLTTGKWIYLIIGEFATNYTELILYFAVTAFITPFILMVIGYKLCSWFSRSHTKEEQKIA